MRSQWRFSVLVFVILSLVGCSTTAVRSIPFSTRGDHFAPGDSIVISEVLSSERTAIAPRKVTVRGLYSLHSEARARIVLSESPFITGGMRSLQVLSEIEVGPGSARFELELQTSRSSLSISLSDLFSGRPFGATQVQF